MNTITKRQAIKEVRECADYIIEQRNRQAKGYDQGRYRDDDTLRSSSIKQTVRETSAYAFNLSKQFQGVTA